MHVIKYKIETDLITLLLSFSTDREGMFICSTIEISARRRCPKVISQRMKRISSQRRLEKMSHYVALVNRSNATRGSWRAVEKNWCIGSMEVTVFRGVRLARASHPHTCAHKYTARVLTISTGYAAPSCERLGRYVVTMKGVAFEDEKLSPVRFILPLAVARC